MIIAGSRYQDGDLQPILHMGRDAGTTRLAVFRPTTDVTKSRYVVLARSGERWDLVADRILDESDGWWRILDANAEIIDPFSVKPGLKVNVP